MTKDEKDKAFKKYCGNLSYLYLLKDILPIFVLLSFLAFGIAYNVNNIYLKILIALIWILIVSFIIVIGKKTRKKRFYYWKDISCKEYIEMYLKKYQYLNKH